VWAFIAVGVMAAGVAAIAASRARRFSRLDATRADVVRVLAQEDVEAFSGSLREPTLAAARASADPRAREQLEHAAACLRRATEALARARRPPDFVRVTAPLAEGDHALASGRALLAGDKPPPVRVVCFFDPRHGRSVRDVEWSPDGRATGTVPACQDDGDRIERGQPPLARHVTVNGSLRPYWDAPSWYADWAAGYFGGMASVGLPGRLFEYVPGPEWSPEELFLAGYKDARGWGVVVGGGHEWAGNADSFDRS
jgi:hypothetical protein